MLNKQKLIKNYQLDLSHCTSLTLISSESCNLNCSYCVMANNINKKEHLKEAEKVKQSFIDGTFLLNLKNIIQKYNIDCNKIEIIDLWGQEPTLTLNEFSNVFPELYVLFPNLQKLFFSTNGVAFVDRIINLIKIIDNTTIKPFVVELQFSYDGEDATQNLRGISPLIIKRNIDTFINELNLILLKNTNVLLNFHNVINADMINKYGFDDTNDNEFYAFLKEIHDLGIYFNSLNTNHKVEVADHFSPGLINPYNATQQEGKNLASFMKKADKLGKDFELKWWKGLLYQFNQYLPPNPNDYIGLNAIPSLLKTSSKYIQPLSLLSGCGFGHSNLKIRYDGTILHCQNAIATLNLNECINKEGYIFEVQKELMKKNYYPNLLKNDDEFELLKFFERSKIARESSFPHYLTETLNLLILLANSNQIDLSYKTNRHKLFHHAMILSQMFICWDNSLSQTGSGFGKTAGEIRFMCNGFLDLVDNTKDEFINKCRGNGVKYDN